MGFQGQLSSVNLTDIFQTLNMNRQTGTLTVSGENVQYVWFEAGQIALCTAQPVNGRPYLLHALMHKGLVSAEQADDLAQRLIATRQPLRELILASGLVMEADLDEVCAWCIEETICPVFEWKSGEFSFTDGQPLDEVTIPDAIAMGAARLQTTSLVLEATRREDEWKRIREVIPDAGAFYIVDSAGRANLKNVESDPEMLKVLRFLDGRHSIDIIADTVGVSRFDAFAIVAQLVLASIARPRTPQEAIEDALALRGEGDLAKARELLETTLRQHNVPEVLRPLAEICVELQQVPRAVELYLELIQRSQDAGDAQSALTDLDTVIKLSPADPDLHYDRAQVLADLGRGDEAALAYVAAAQAYLATRDVNQAVDACHRAKNLQPRAAEPHRWLAKAYLIDGQTENAAIEYKSLWHALLSCERPRKALEELRRILEADCKFAAIKEQVIAHAQSSEAVKTGNAVRLLVYAVMAVVLVVGGFIAWDQIYGTIEKRRITNEIAAFRHEMSGELQAGRHGPFIERLRLFAASYPGAAEEVAQLEATVIEDAGKRAEREFAAARALYEKRELEAAAEAFTQLRKRFPMAAPAADGRDTEWYLSAIKEETEDSRWKRTLAQLDGQWQADEWEPAVTQLGELLASKDMPTRMREALLPKLENWQNLLRNAEAMYRRAERLERNGRKLDAFGIYQRTTPLEGNWASRARDKVAVIERDFASELVGRIQDAFARGDDPAAFATLDELDSLARKSTNARGVHESLDLPFTLLLDSRHAFLVVRRKGQADQSIAAPAGTTGGWSHKVAYRVGETVTVEVRRPGFTAQSVSISASSKRSQASVKLKRGPLWQADLKGAIPTTAPVAAGKVLLVGTNRSTLEVIDTSLGSSNPIAFPDSVAELSAAPFVFRNRAYVVIDDRIVAINLDTRTLTWSWPRAEAAEQPQLFPGSLWVQEHELITGRIQIFAGSTSGRLIALGAEGDKIIASPALPLEAGLTGAPLVDRLGLTSTLYVPAGPRLLAFDAAAVSERTPPRRLFAVTTRGDVVGRPVRAEVAGRPAILVADASGLVVAIDADPNAVRKELGSWSLEGTPAHGVRIARGTPIAYIATSEGSVLLLDLATPGKLLKRFPPQATMGALPGAPAIGRNGVYVADASGILWCIDRQTGNERWQCDFGNQVSTGILAHEGRIYVPTRGGSVLCFEEGEHD